MAYEFIEPRAPRYWLRGLVVLATVAAIAIVVIGVASPAYTRPSGCVINGFGNKLCGDDAIAYCQLLANNGGFANASTRDTCTNVGWSDTEVR